MNAISTAAATLAGKEVFKKVVVGIYEYCLNEAGHTLKQWSTERQIETLFRKISQVRKVKTIWQVDKSVDLLAFYCDSHVLLGKKRKRIAQLDDFGLNDNIVIQGIAGQGKSIFLRYLCANELWRGQYIPLFLELRRINHDASLKDRIENAFHSLGLSVDQTLFNALASSGKVLLLLDAFDEVPDELKSQVLTDIEDLASRHEHLRIIVTSRPNHNIQTSNHFTVVTLDNLQGTEYAQVINKLAVRQAWAQELIEHVEKRASHIKELLCTPLMVTLLVLSYKSYQKLPAKLSDFYDSLFQTLLQRHDGTKPGFTRQRGCSLDDNEYRLVFEVLCILAKKKSQKGLSSRIIYDLSKDALSQCGYKSNPGKYVDDIVRITCLIVRDGEEYRFIHKTVQEYHTASYIQKKPDKWASNFYGRVFKKNVFREWQQELEFLSEIDSYRYNRYFYFPAILDLLQIVDNDFENDMQSVPLEYIYSLFDNLTVGCDKAHLNRLRFFWSPRKANILRTHLLNNLMNHAVMGSHLMAKDFLELTVLYPDLIVPKPKDIEIMPESADMTYISVGKALRKGGVPYLYKEAQRECDKLVERARSIRMILGKEENVSILEGLV